MHSPGPSGSDHLVHSGNSRPQINSPLPIFRELERRSQVQWADTFSPGKQNIISLAGSTLAVREPQPCFRSWEHTGSQRGSGDIPAAISAVCTLLAQLCGAERLPVLKRFSRPLLCLGWTAVDTGENLHCPQVCFQT